MICVPICGFASVRLFVLPEALAHLRAEALHFFPALRFEYVQVLVLVACPLILLATILIVDLRTRHRVLAAQSTVTFRPSLAVRCAWIFGMIALAANVFLSHHQRWILLTANLLALLELVRTFPRNLIIAADGLHWRSFTRSVSVPWEHISCFAQKRTAFGTEYQLCGNEDQVFIVSSAVIPAWRQIVRGIAINLSERHLQPASSAPSSLLNSLHRLLLPIALLITIAGSQLTRN